MVKADELGVEGRKALERQSLGKRVFSRLQGASFARL